MTSRFMATLVNPNHINSRIAAYEFKVGSADNQIELVKRRRIQNNILFF